MVSKIETELIRTLYLNKSIDTLLDRGYTYAQLAEALINSKINGLIEYIDDKYVLSTAGYSLITEIKPFEPISTLDNVRIPQISIDDIYIPDILKRRNKR